MPIRRLLLPALALLISSALAQSDPPPVKSWGRYTLQYTPRNEARTYIPAQVLLKQGTRTLLTASDDTIRTELQPLRPGGLPELVITLYSGGAHCCTTTLIYTQDNGRLENIGVLEQGNYPARYADLNGDGTKEVVVYSDGLAYYDWSFASSPALGTVLGWDGLRLADRTRAYAYLPGQLAVSYFKELLNELKTAAADDEGPRAELSGYYGNMILAGRGLDAERVLRSQVFSKSPTLAAWFSAHRGDLIGASYAQPEGRLSIFSGAVYPPPDQQP
ncbi:FG-GAP repeat domain-containing protein [Deinococcus sp.]|uniref:FG-GAP repeat domain-containing protein n=1 Tax=Deinococcus sp. TaxID=47478 RepID=UPI003CC5F2BB